MTALVGRTLGGRFRLTGFLGEGAMAGVYRGEWNGEPREVAVKVMHTELLSDPTFAKRFTREAKAAAKIVHRNSVRILEHGADGELLYLAMELLLGQDMFELLAREKRLAPARAAAIVEQICGPLAVAHGFGIVHRDLKPENVMIVPDPMRPGADLVKVLDFGIAKILESPLEGPPSSNPADSGPPTSALTRVGGLVGTPEYMSPEQAVGGAVDARSDLYACGVLLFHAVTGQQPFTGKHPLDVIMQVGDKDKLAPLPSSILPSIPPDLERIIVKAMSKPPEHRYQSAAELAADLGAFLRGGAVRAPPSVRPAMGSDPGEGLLAAGGTLMITTPRISERPPPDTLRSRAAAGGQAQNPPPSRVNVPSPAAFMAPTPPVAETEPSSDVDPLAQTAAVDSMRQPSPETTRTPSRGRDEPAETRRGLDRQALSNRRNALPTWVIVLAALVVGTLIGVALYLRLR
jgi:serine/threonine-protein kinase